MKDRFRSLAAWFDNGSYTDDGQTGIDWPRVIPFIGIHLACLAVIWTGVSLAAVLLALGSYGLRMFAITAFYHRYFSHRAFKASRPVQLVFAILGATATQRGPLWWAAHHRSHHRHADSELDPHSPRAGFWHSHVGWFLDKRNFHTRLDQVPDLARFPELRWLDRFDVVVPILYGATMFGTGKVLNAHYPGWGIDGGQALVWGYFISTVLLYHATFLINSLAHRAGKRTYATADDSRNNMWLAILTMGEGWHNNHHHFPGSARQGFRPWQWDPSYYLLAGLRSIGLVSDLKQPVQITRRRNTTGVTSEVKE